MSTIAEYETELALVERSLNMENDTQFAKDRQALLRANISDLKGFAYAKKKYAYNFAVPERKHDMYHLYDAIHRQISERDARFEIDHPAIKKKLLLKL
jgi:hypothetical protein